MYLFKPLDTHYDQGFGAIADSFQASATVLKEQYNRSSLNGHLPICYLYRHSIELFLKGSIIIVHQGLKIPYGTEPYTSDPKISINGKLRSIFNIHEINVLYKYLSNILAENKSELVNIYFSWEFSDDLALKIEQLDEIDLSSAYFRYPVDKKTDIYKKGKSAFKETTVKNIMNFAMQNQEPMKTMKILYTTGQGESVFVHDDSFTEEVMIILEEVADELETCHFALMRTIGSE